MSQDGYFRDKCRPQVEKYASLLEKLLVEKGAPLFNGEKVRARDFS
jgi:hypothetical protein